MSTMAAPRSRRRLFPLRPGPLPWQRLFLASTAAASAITFLFLVIVILSTSPPSRHHVVTMSSSTRSPPPHHCDGAAGLGELGGALVSMLPADLPFTVFAPSADAFRRVLNLRPPNGTAAHADAESDDTYYAVLSRVLGFSAVPRRLLAADVPAGSARAVVLDSVSGLRIHVARDGDAALVANGVRSECVDLVRGEAVVHVMAGVLMDAEFERSFAL